MTQESSAKVSFHLSSIPRSVDGDYTAWQQIFIYQHYRLCLAN